MARYDTGGSGGGGYYSGTGGWHGGYETAPGYDPDYRGPGTDLGEDIRRGYVGRGLYTRSAVGPGSRGPHEYDVAGGYGRRGHRGEGGGRSFYRRYDAGYQAYTPGEYGYDQNFGGRLRHRGEPERGRRGIPGQRYDRGDYGRRSGWGR